ncbi:MAG: phosphoribosyltransferase [Hyphomicrobium sp.]
MYYSYENFDAGIQMLADQVIHSGKKYDYLCGVLRGGMIPAIVLSYKLNIPVLPIHWSLRDFKQQYLSPDARKIVLENKCLLVEDIIDTGECISQLFKEIGKSLDVLCLVYNKSQSITPQFYHWCIDRNRNKDWIVFWWDESNNIKFKKT